MYNITTRKLSEGLQPQKKLVSTA